MRLHMAEPCAFRGGHRGERTELVEHCGLSSAGAICMARRQSPTVGEGGVGTEAGAAVTRRALVLRCITSGSPAWKPQAMLAESTIASSASSSPIFQARKDSPDRRSDWVACLALRVLGLRVRPVG